MTEAEKLLEEWLEWRLAEVDPDAPDADDQRASVEAEVDALLSAPNPVEALEELDEFESMLPEQSFGSLLAQQVAPESWEPEDYPAGTYVLNGQMVTLDKAERERFLKALGSQPMYHTTRQVEMGDRRARQEAIANLSDEEKAKLVGEPAQQSSGLPGSWAAIQEERRRANPAMSWTREERDAVLGALEDR